MRRCAGLHGDADRQGRLGPARHAGEERCQGAVLPWLFVVVDVVGVGGGGGSSGCRCGSHGRLKVAFCQKLL